MLEWLILGAGGWGTNYVRAARAQRGVRIVGYADTNPKALRALRAEGVEAALLFDDAIAALKATRPDIVSCSVPNPQRIPILLAALKAAPAVIVDKPLAHSAADVRKIIAAAGKSDARVCVAQDYRYKPGAQKVKALLEAGRLGRLSNVTLAFLRNTRFQHDTFYAGLEGPTAIGLEMAIHHWDLMRWLLDREPQTVEARSWHPKPVWGRGDTALHALAGFDGGLRATYAADWACRATHTSWNGRWLISGERADLVWDDAEDGTVDVRLVRRGARGQTERCFSPRAKLFSMDVIVKRFVGALKSGGPMPVPLDDNVRSIGLALAAVESCRRGKGIEVPRFMEKEGLSCR